MYLLPNQYWEDYTNSVDYYESTAIPTFFSFQYTPNFPIDIFPIYLILPSNLGTTRLTALDFGPLFVVIVLSIF